MQSGIERKTQSGDGGGVKNFKKIGIIGAMKEEIEKIQNSMNPGTDFQIKTIAGMKFVELEIGNKSVVAVQSGVGKVNAGVCTQILVDLYGVDLVMNTGIAGALHKSVDVGDIVISTDLVQHDMDATGFGYEKGQIPGIPITAFPTDDELRKLAFEVCEEVNPDIRVFTGRIVSGDRFVSDSALKKRLVEDFSGYCTEMEGAAIAQVAYLNNISCLVLRAMSDKADEEAHVSFEAIRQMAIEHCTKLTLGLIRRLP